MSVSLEDVEMLPTRILIQNSYSNFQIRIRIWFRIHIHFHDSFHIPIRIGAVR